LDDFSGATSSLAGSKVDMQIDLNPLLDPFPAAGIIKTLVLRVTDNISQTRDASFDVTFKKLPSNPPLIKFNASQEGIFIQQGEGFSLNASGTSDPDGDTIRSVVWDVNNDGTADIVWNRTDTNGDGQINDQDDGPGYLLQMTWGQMAAYAGLQSTGRRLIRLSVTDSTGTVATDTAHP
jgi:hypothetical protein